MLISSVSPSPHPEGISFCSPRFRREFRSVESPQLQNLKAGVAYPEGIPSYSPGYHPGSRPTELPLLRRSCINLALFACSRHVSIASQDPCPLCFFDQRAPPLPPRSLPHCGTALLPRRCAKRNWVSVFAGGWRGRPRAPALCSVSRTRTPADTLRDLKRSSSAWLKGRDSGLRDFAWQNGYGIFSVGFSQVEQVRRYIAGQPEHHRKVSFQDELRSLLKRYQMQYDERYVWD